MKTVTGEYNQNGYTILFDGEPVYNAGNNPRDSKQPAEPGRELPLEKIRAFCCSTAIDMAKEQGAEFGGVRRIED